MALVRWQATVQDEKGDYVVNPSVTVRNAADNSLADIYDDAGSAKANPFLGTSEGFVAFKAYPGRYTISGVKDAETAQSWIVDLFDAKASKLSYESIAAFEADKIADDVTAWSITVSGVTLDYLRDDNATYPAVTSANGVKGIPASIYTPLHYGALGDGSTDDATALNAVFEAYKAAVEAFSNQAGSIILDGLGLRYYTTASINATGITAFGAMIRNMTIYGACAGKAVLDCIGSRGGVMSHVVIVGDADDMPSIGIQFARAAAGGQEFFCDNWTLDNVKTLGYFSDAGGYFYGQETTTYNHCAFWNSNYDGYAALHVGYNVIPMASDYLAPISGGTSYINDKYINCDYRFSPSGNVAAITGITQANPAVFTAVGHPFEVGQTVVVGYIGGGMVQANGTVATIAAVTDDTITLGGVDSTGWTAYTTGGSVYLAQTKPTVVFARGSQHFFDNCYFVNYGTDHIHFDFPDGFVPLDIRFDALFEGTGNYSCLKFTSVSTGRAIRGFDLKTYAVHSNTAVVGSDAGAGTVTLSDARITCLSLSNAETPKVFDDETNFSINGGSVTTFLSGSVVPDDFINFKGQITNISDQTVTRYSDYLKAASIGHNQGRGFGGTVTQETSKTTAVTLNKRTGNIVTHDSELLGNESAIFSMLNSTIDENSTVIVNTTSPASRYRAEALRVLDGRVDIRVTNLSSSGYSENVGINFVVIGGAVD